MNVEATSFIPDRDRDSIDPPIGSQYPSSSRGYRSNTPSPPTTRAPVNDNSLWSSTNDGSASKYIPSQGPWGIIPSRTIMISNLPKTTQLWTLVELLKVAPKKTVWMLMARVLEIELGFSPRQSRLMDRLLSLFMIFVMRIVVFVIFVQTISLRLVDLIPTLSRS